MDSDRSFGEWPGPGAMIESPETSPPKAEARVRGSRAIIAAPPRYRAGAAQDGARQRPDRPGTRAQTSGVTRPRVAGCRATGGRLTEPRRLRRPQSEPRHTS